MITYLTINFTHPIASFHGAPKPYRQSEVASRISFLVPGTEEQSGMSIVFAGDNGFSKEEAKLTTFPVGKNKM